MSSEGVLLGRFHQDSNSATCVQMWWRTGTIMLLVHTALFCKTLSRNNAIQHRLKNGVLREEIEAGVLELLWRLAHNQAGVLELAAYCHWNIPFRMAGSIALNATLSWTLYPLPRGLLEGKRTHFVGGDC